MRRKDLKHFAQWLEDDRGMVDSSINTYLSNVRRLLRAVDNDYTNADVLVTTFMDIPDTARNGTRSAWKAFGDYLEAQGQVRPIAMPRHQKHARQLLTAHHAKATATVQTMPDMVLAGLREIQQRQGHALDFLARLKWSHVTTTPFVMEGLDGTPGIAGIVVENPESRKLPGVVMPEALLDALKAWGRPNSTDHPLIPQRPGQPAHWPTELLQRLVTAGPQAQR